MRLSVVLVELLDLQHGFDPQAFAQAIVANKVEFRVSA